MLSGTTSPWSPAARPDALLRAADLFDPPPDSDRETAHACALSLKRLIVEAWPIVEPATPFVDNWHTDVVCEHLEAVTAGELRRLIINVPPRTMKSLTTCVFWPAWEWLNAAHVRWLFASYAQDFAWRDSLKMRRLIKSQGGREDGTVFQRIGYQGVLRLLHPTPWELTKDQDAKSKYETTETGMRMATSVEGQATGEGGDRIVVDDPVNAKQARSDADRGAVNIWWDETMTTRFNNDRAAAVIVMQRLHADDLTGHLLAQGGWHHLCLPAEYEPKHPFVYPAKAKTAAGFILSGDKRKKQGELLDPVRLSATRLAELRTGLGSYGFAGQMQQLPAPAEGGMLKKTWWRRWNQLPPQWQRQVQSWDMAFKDTKSSSYVVGGVWGVDGADRYLLAMIRAQLDFTSTIAAVQALTAAYPAARAKLVEDKANGTAVINSLKRTVGGLIPISPGSDSKSARASAVTPIVEAGNVYLPPGPQFDCPSGFPATTVSDFIEECAVFPNGTHDDMVDMTSQALNWLEQRAEGAMSTPIRPEHAEPVTVRGDRVLRGERYIDKD